MSMMSSTITTAPYTSSTFAMFDAGRQPLPLAIQYSRIKKVRKHTDVFFCPRTLNPWANLAQSPIKVKDVPEPPKFVEVPKRIADVFFPLALRHSSAVPECRPQGLWRPDDEDLPLSRVKELMPRFTRSLERRAFMPSTMKTISIPLALFIALTSVGLVSSFPTFSKRFGVTLGTTSDFTYSGTAGSRDYNVYTPNDYSTSSSVPLVVVIHGCTQTPSSTAADSQFNALADKEQFIAAYPSQSLSANPSRCWNWFLPADQARGSGEPAIIAGIAQTIQNNTAWNIDKNRTYVVGVSSGAAMSVILGVTYPDVFAAIGVGSGYQYKSATALFEAEAQSVRPGPDPVQQGHIAYQAMGSYVRRIPTIVFHGTADTVVPEIHGQEVVISMAVANSLADPSFTNTNFYAPTSDMTTQAPVLDNYTYSAASWNDVNGKPVVQFYLVYGMNHAWSGGAPPLVNGADTYTDPRGPRFTDIAYKFFLDNPRSA
ncbi:Esterase PHB depolymerase domain containing protein [Amanita muscaria]